jgi:DNA-binding NarL/FixJ family response regulator
MPSVLIVDDHLLVRQGLKHMLNQEYRGLVFGEAKSSAEAMTFLARRRWDIVTLDVSMPGQDGFYVLQEIRRRYPATRVLVLSVHADPQYAARARQMRASGYICKNAGRAEVLKAFKRLLNGEEHFDGSLSLPAVSSAVSRPPALSKREHAVMLAFAAGKRTGEIAAELNLSAKTVSTYKRRLLDKLGLRSTADLVRYAIDQRLS